MIVREVMKTELVTVKPDDTLSHAANLLRQYQFHHLPVISHVYTDETYHTEYGTRKAVPVLEGLLTSQDIDLAVAQEMPSSDGALHKSWQERHVNEVMHRANIRVTPTTNVAAAAQILVERGLNCLPVVEYGDQGQGTQAAGAETRTVLVGLLTRSDLLIALARMLGAYEPGMRLVLSLPMGDMTPLSRTLFLASELHIHVHSVVAAPLEGTVPRVATVHLGTINPTPLLIRLKKEHIQYSFADSLVEGDAHA